MSWIGIDFDGTLATYDVWRGPEHTGEPVDRMVRLVKDLIREGQEVRIFTGRCAPGKEGWHYAEQVIGDWCQEHIGQRLPVTCCKDHKCVAIYDDIAWRVERNTGEVHCRIIEAADIGDF